MNKLQEKVVKTSKQKRKKKKRNHRKNEQQTGKCEREELNETGDFNMAEIETDR